MRLRAILKLLSAIGVLCLAALAVVSFKAWQLTVSLTVPTVVVVVGLAILLGSMATAFCYEINIVAKIKHWRLVRAHRQAFTRARKLMIVAHADDETIFGGGHLLASDGWFVACLTDGDNPARREEFQRAMRAVGAAFEHWTFRNNKYDGWTVVDEVMKLKFALSRVIRAKEWELIVTHNPAGEYGHIQHKQLSQFVSGICGEKVGKLNYFGDFSQEPLAPRLPEAILKRKIDILRFYQTQAFIFEWLGGHFPFEDWQAAAAWADHQARATKACESFPGSAVVHGSIGV